jgi:hypothetical protein
VALFLASCERKARPEQITLGDMRGVLYQPVAKASDDYEIWRAWQ